MLTEAQSIDAVGVRRQLTLGVAHHEAFARLVYVVEHGRQTAVLTGPSGAGKSALLHRLAGRVMRSGRQAVLLDCGGASSVQLTRQLADQMHLWPTPADDLTEKWRDIADELTGRQASNIETVFLFDHLDRTSSGVDLLRRIDSFRDRFSDSGITIIVAAQSHLDLRKRCPLRPALQINLQPPSA